MINGGSLPAMASADHNTGSPYCLRRDSIALRNMRDYSGVSASRLEVLEERLRSDVIAEIGEFHGRVLLHSESSDGDVVPVWEGVDNLDVASIREVMDEAKARSKELSLNFVRIPVTSESSPDVSKPCVPEADTPVPRFDRASPSVPAGGFGNECFYIE